MSKTKEQEIKELQQEIELMLLKKILEVGYSALSSYTEIYRKFKEAKSYEE
jgi:hypothetical protein